ncbi:MAG: outer membrane lipoprotein carrier protein LolA [Desulfobacterales bacterium]|nr:outer membrane lipoprotein carrier protein LolA [Desulfobacterales bacterium]
MGRKTRQTAVLLLVVSAVLTLGWGSTEEEIREAAAGVDTVQAGFVQEKHMKMLARPLVSRGLFCYEAPGSLRWEYTDPVKSLLLMHAGRTRRFTFQDGKWVEEAGFDLQAMQVVVEQIAGWMAGRFDENDLFTARLLPERRIRLTPKNPAFGRYIERIELTLSPVPGVMESVTLHEGENSFTRIRFTSPAVNRPVPDGWFTEVR